jgi:hypothetical protein
VKTGELWRQAPDLAGVNLTTPKWRFLDGCIRINSGIPEVLFLLMEIYNKP